MKMTGVWATTAFLLTTLTDGTANAENAAFILANNTAFTVHSVHIWPSESPHPGPDRLGRAILRSGEAYPFTPDDGECMYNIRVTLEGTDYEQQWDNVNLCSLSTFTLNYNYLNQNLSASGR